VGHFGRVSKKSAQIARLIESCQGRELEAHYLGYFECFNQGLFYESHDVLEELWLQDRQGPDGNFFKGLIQFAGAFVHLQKHTAERPRLRPSAALLKLAHANLQTYPPRHRQLNLERLRGLIVEWLGWLESGNFEVNPLATQKAPLLKLQGPS
jgi:predicted metal-dependent hydrolase